MAESYFTAPAKYCEKNNINWTTITNLIEELTMGPLETAKETAIDSMTAVVNSVENAIPAWAYSAEINDDYVLIDLPQGNEKHAFAQPGQGLMASFDDFAMENTPLNCSQAWSMACFTGISSVESVY